MNEEQIIVSVVNLNDERLRALYNLIAAELNRRDGVTFRGEEG